MVLDDVGNASRSLLPGGDETDRGKRQLERRIHENPKRIWASCRSAKFCRRTPFYFGSCARSRETNTADDCWGLTFDACVSSRVAFFVYLMGRRDVFSLHDASSPLEPSPLADGPQTEIHHES